MTPKKSFRIENDNSRKFETEYQGKYSFIYDTQM